MKISDIIRKIADQLDQEEQGEQGELGLDAPDNSHLHAGLDSVDDAASDEEESDVNVQTMTPPLQQKLELLKKAAGVPSMFDDEESHDELDDIKQIAGIKPVAIHIASDDEPFGE